MIGRPRWGATCQPRWQKQKWYILDLCVSSLRRGHANLLCIVPILADDLFRGSTFSFWKIINAVRANRNAFLWHKRFLQGKKDIQHPRFPCSPLPKYWSGPTVLNFAVRMGCGAFTVVWPYDECPVSKSYSCLKTKKKIKISTLFLSLVLFYFSLVKVSETPAAPGSTAIPGPR